MVGVNVESESSPLAPDDGDIVAPGVPFCV